MALKDNLISYWKLEESANATRVDSHGSNDLNVSNTVGQDTSGVDGNAAEFVRASAESLAIADNASLSITGDFSVSAWVKIGTRGQDNGIVSKYMSTGNKRAFMVLITGGNDLQAYCTADGLTTNRIIGESTSEFIGSGDVGNWVHVVATVDISAGSVVLYKNGSSVSVTHNNAGTVSSIQDNDLNFELGEGNQASDSDKLDGSLDEVAIWEDKILTSDEVSEIYNSGTGLFYDDWDAASSSSIKSINGILQANIKSWNGVAIADVKSFNGISNV